MPMREIATLSLRFMPPLYVPAGLSITSKRFTLRRASSVACRSLSPCPRQRSFNVSDLRKTRAPTVPQTADVQRHSTDGASNS